MLYNPAYQLQKESFPSYSFWRTRILVWVLKLEISTNLQRDAPSNHSSLTTQPYNPTSTVLVYDVAPRMLTCLFTRANGKVTILYDAKLGEDVNTRRHCRHQHRIVERRAPQQ